MRFSALAVLLMIWIKHDTTLNSNRVECPVFEQAMHVSFGMAAEHGGVCFLRYDDTNPEAEKQEYIDHIQDIVSWLGWKPWKVSRKGIAASSFWQDCQ